MIVQRVKPTATDAEQLGALVSAYYDTYRVRIAPLHVEIWPAAQQAFARRALIPA